MYFLVVKLSEIGIFGNTENIGQKILDYIGTIDSQENLELVFDEKEYYFTSENCINQVVYMTNTVTKEELPDMNRRFGLLFSNNCNLTLNGNGAKLLFDGRMSEIGLINCQNITIENFEFDFINPTVSEFKVIHKTDEYMDIVPNDNYKIIDGKFRFDSDIGTETVTQVYLGEDDYTKRINSLSWKPHPLSYQSKAEQKDGFVRIYIKNKQFKEGLIYQIYCTKRDSAAFFLERSSGVTLKNCRIKFMHGMGVLAQLSENITITNCTFVPNKEKNRTIMSFADIIHCSMCKGLIEITNSEFEGSCDDVINVHGNFFSIEKIQNNEITVKYMHCQTFGIDAFRKGDQIEIVNNKTFQKMWEGKVIDYKIEDEYTTIIKVDRPLSKKIKSGYCVENITNSPDLHVDGIECRHIPTRGILCTTRGRVLIENSRFYKTYMSPIHVSCDASTWFESGCVRNITVRNNEFVECLDPNISIFPENCSKFIRKPIHKNILVEGNVFKMCHNDVVRIKRTENFVFKNNKVKGCKRPRYRKIDCKNITIL